MDTGLEIIKLKSNLKLYRQMFKHFKFLIKKTEDELQKHGVVIVTASDPLAQRGSTNGT